MVSFWGKEPIYPGFHLGQRAENGDDHQAGAAQAHGVFLAASLHQGHAQGRKHSAEKKPSGQKQNILHHVPFTTAVHTTIEINTRAQQLPNSPRAMA